MFQGMLVGLVVSLLIQSSIPCGLIHTVWPAISCGFTLYGPHCRVARVAPCGLTYLLTRSPSSPRLQLHQHQQARQPHECGQGIAANYSARPLSLLPLCLLPLLPSSQLHQHQQASQPHGRGRGIVADVVDLPKEQGLQPALELRGRRYRR